MSAPVGSQSQEGEVLEAGMAKMSINSDTTPEGDEVLPLEPLYKRCMKYYKGKK